jgi:transposase
MSLLLSRKQKEALVIKLAREGKTTREIAKIVHISLLDIGKIIAKETGDAENSQGNKEKEKPKSHYAKAFKMFRKKKSLTQVVVELDINALTVFRVYDDYLALKRMEILVEIYPEILLNYNWNLFYHLYRKIKEEGLDKQDVTEILQNKNISKDLKYELRLYHNRISELKDRKSALEQEINDLQKRRDNYDGINPI